MTEDPKPVDACIVSGLDDIDLLGMEMRLNLVLSTCVGAVHAGTEGVSNGFNLASPDTGFKAIVFVHEDSIGLWSHHSGDVRANASFQMPADDRLKQALERGEEGLVMMVDQWRRIMRSNPSRHVPALDHDPEISAHLLRTSEIIDAVVSTANPHFPTWNTITSVSATWVGGGSITVGGRRLLSAQAERMVIDALPRIVEVKPHSIDRGYVMLPYETSHKFSSKDPVAVLRTLGENGIDLPAKVLRKAGMQR